MSVKYTHQKQKHRLLHKLILMPAIMKGWNIMDEAFDLHETMSYAGKKTKWSYFLKANYEKVQNKVVQSFLPANPPYGRIVTQMVYVDWQLYFPGSAVINVNDDVGNYFRTTKGSCQGHPLSPIMLNITANMLPVLVERAGHGQISMVIPQLLGDGLAILEYCDDTKYYNFYGWRSKKEKN